MSSPTARAAKPTLHAHFHRSLLPPVPPSCCATCFAKTTAFFSNSAALHHPPADESMTWRNTDTGNVDGGAWQALCLVVQPTVVVALAILTLTGNCLTSPHLLSTFCLLENPTENRVLGVMVNYRPDFENHSPRQSFSGACPLWDVAPPNSLRGTWPDEMQSEGCRIWPRVRMMLVHPPPWAGPNCSVSDNFISLNWRVVAEADVSSPWRWYPTAVMATCRAVMAGVATAIALMVAIAFGSLLSNKDVPTSSWGGPMNGALWWGAEDTAPRMCQLSWLFPLLVFVALNSNVLFVKPVGENALM